MQAYIFFKFNNWVDSAAGGQILSPMLFTIQWLFKEKYCQFHLTFELRIK